MSGIEPVVRGVYLLDARNFHIGVWNGKTFVGIRYKFGQFYLDDEYPHTNGPPFGTATPLKLLKMLPEDVEPSSQLDTYCQACGKAAWWGGPPAPAPWKCESNCEKVSPIARSNTLLFKYLQAEEQAYIAEDTGL